MTKPRNATVANNLLYASITAFGIALVGTLADNDLVWAGFLILGFIFLTSGIVIRRWP